MAATDPHPGPDDADPDDAGLDYADLDDADPDDADPDDAGPADGQAATEAPLDAEIVPDPSDDDAAADGAAGLPGADLIPGGAPGIAPLSDGTGPPPVVPDGDYTSAGVPTFDYVRDRIEGRFATSIGAAELAGGTAPTASVEDQFAERERAGRERLEQLRRSMRRDDPAPPAQDA
jgi:hypothetical protein